MATMRSLSFNIILHYKAPVAVLKMHKNNMFTSFFFKNIFQTCHSAIIIIFGVLLYTYIDLSINLYITH